VAIYSDGFKQHKSLSDVRSVGGCYMLPLGLSSENRRSSAAFHVLTLCPSGHDVNDCLNMISEDLEKSVRFGIVGRDSYGRRVRIFIDPTTYLGDYPATAAISDTMGHTADAHCTLCAIRRKKGSRHGEIVFNCDINSRRIGYMRTDIRMKAIREGKLPSSLMNKLGSRCTTQSEASKLPGVLLGERMELLRNQIPLSEEGLPIFHPFFDSHQSAAAVPDHLLTGLIKNVITLCFEELRLNDLRAKYEYCIMDCLVANGLPFSGRILRWDKSGKYKGLLNHTMSTLFCLLLISAPIFSEHYRKSRSLVFLLPQRLQHLVKLVYRWPSKIIDGKSYDPPMREEHAPYLRSLNEAGKTFVKACDDLILQVGDRAKMIDKPNAHRALELCAHTIPNFGHARNCSEMILEMMHRNFKSWMEHNTNSNSHITAVDHAVVRDWMGRLYSLYAIWSNGTEEEKKCAETGLRRLLLGENGVQLTAGRQGENVLSKLRSALHPALQEPVKSMLQSAGYVSLPWRTICTWKAIKVDRLEECTEDERIGLQVLRLRFFDAGKEDLKLYKKARMVYIEEYGGRRKCYKYNTLDKGHAISAIVRSVRQDDRVIEVCDDGDGYQSIFAVFGFSTIGREVWAFVRELQCHGEGMKCSMTCPISLIKLCKGVRRVGLVHLCDKNCTHSFGNVLHSSSLVNGGIFIVLTRMDGYPPHLG